MRFRFNPTTVNMGSVVEKETMGQAFI